MSRILALDYGTVRIGVAMSDPLRLTAQPLDVLAADDWHDALERLVAEYQIEEIVVGLPTSLDGSETAAAMAARSFGEEVAALTGLPVSFVDERFSTRIAHDAMLAADASRATRRGNIDKVAAAVILQSWLDRR